MLGGFITIFGIIAIVMIHETGHFIAAKRFGMKATEYFFGFGPKIWSTTRGETEYGIKAIPAGGYVRIIGMSPLEEIPPEEEHRTYRGKPFWQKSIVVMAGVASHFVVAFVLLWTADVVIGHIDNDSVTLTVAAVVSETSDGQPTAAALAGIEEGDRFVAVDGVAVGTWDEFTDILQAQPDEAVTLAIDRGGEELIVRAQLTSRVDAETGERSGFLGVSPRFDKERENPITGLGSSAREVGVMTGQAVEGFWEFVTNFGDFVSTVFSGEVADDGSRPVSAVGLVQLGANEELGLNFTLRLLAFFSIFVGLLNAIPVYPFDGGHFFVALYEKLTGRHPDVRKLVPVSAAIFLFLMVLGVLAIYFDIVNPISLS